MVLDQSLINKIDDHKVVFISDRAEKLNVFDSKLICEETTSCTKLIYKKFKSKFEIPVDLKKLILYVDDYNCYNLKHKESEYLNGIYRNTRYNRFNAFVKRFWNGYDGLSDKEMESAESFFSAIENEYSGLDKFEGTFKGWSVLVVVNTDTQFVSFRKKPESTADIAFMAENLCNGGGSANASGGKISQKFLDFTTKLEQL
jgi:oligoribonuclease NrnB/cAMP/cGMP phosphodiesterase (DHH superfamily)